MYSRRRALAVAVAGIGALSGCSTASELASGGPIERTAARASLNESAVSETEYEEKDEKTETIEREVEAPGGDRTIVANNQIKLYERSSEVTGEFSTFGVVSTPGFTVANRVLNPVNDMDNDELLEYVGGEFGGISGAEEDSTITRTVLGSEIEITKFQAEIEGEPVYIYAGKTSNERNDDGQKDIIIAAGGYPQRFDDTESDTIEGFFDDIEHPA